MIGQHLEKISFQLAEVGSYPPILGNSWLRKHNPQIDWCENTVTFKSNFYHQKCLPPDVNQSKTQGTKQPSNTPVSICLVSTYGFQTTAELQESQFLAI